MRQDDLERDKERRCVLVGVAGSHNAFCLAPYALKAYAWADPKIRHDWRIDVLQYGLPRPGEAGALVDRIVSDLRSAPIDLVGFSTYMWNRGIYAGVAKRLRAEGFTAPLVFGGPEVSRDWVKAGRYEDLRPDLLVFGEGERPLLDLLRTWPDRPAVAGVAWEGHVGEPRPAMTSILEAPSPYLSGCVDEAVLSRPGVQANIETQRGCSLKCSYCVYHKDMPRIAYGAAERVVAECRYATAKGAGKIRFTDANFGSDLPFAKSVLGGLIDAGLEATLMFELIPGFLDAELADLFAAYNALWPWNYITVGVGVQTINLEVLRRVRRAIRVEKFHETFDLLRTRKIYAKVDLILGLPGEDLASICGTLEYMLAQLEGSEAHLLCCHVMRGIPGAELTGIAERYGMTFSSAREPHELVESPALPRRDVVEAERLTALVFRLVNPGWAKPEVRRAFYRFAGRFPSRVAALSGLAKRIILDRPEIAFSDPDFPAAETWWWERSAEELSDAELLRWMEGV